MSSFAFRAYPVRSRFINLTSVLQTASLHRVWTSRRTLGTALDRASANHRGRIWISPYCGDGFPSRSAPARCVRSAMRTMAGYGEAGALGARDRDEATIAYWAAHPTGHYRELHIIHHAADAFACVKSTSRRWRGAPEICFSTGLRHGDRRRRDRGRLSRHAQERRRRAELVAPLPAGARGDDSRGERRLSST